MASDQDTENALNSSGQVANGIPLVGGILGGTLSGIGGMMAQRRNEDTAAAIGEALDELRSIHAPQFSDQQYNPESFTPEDAAYRTIQEDPRIRNYQLSALQKMQDLANGTADAGYNAQSYKAMNDASQLAAQREGAIRANMAARGLGGSGLELVSRGLAAQNAANRAQSGGLNAAQAAALMRMQGNKDAMSAAGALRGQDFDVNRANADIINRFNMYNTGNRNAANAMNVGNRNSAQQFNINRRDANAQQIFQDNLARHGEQMTGLNSLAGQNNRIADTTGAMFGNLGSSVSSAIGSAYAGSGNSGPSSVTINNSPSGGGGIGYSSPGNSMYQDENYAGPDENYMGSMA